MWPDHPLGVDLARIFEADWCRRVPADALVLGTRCEGERILDRRRHRCRLDPAHEGEHVCWCERTLGKPDGPSTARALRAIVASIGLRLAWIVLIVIALGCAGRGAGTITAPAEFAGTWLGTFWQVNAGDTGYIHGDLAFELRPDGRYAGTWTTRVVAGSSRGGTTQVAGRYTVAGGRVTLIDSRRLTPRRAGETLYGVTVDPGSGRTVQVRLDRTARPSG
ncbi:MAG TPA: hypothetical protein VKJ67_06995 [Methylomirabilota bacterium]|nr:hypothetical protein [Methylomirabilota bacterium]